MLTVPRYGSFGTATSESVIHCCTLGSTAAWATPTPRSTAARATTPRRMVTDVDPRAPLRHFRWEAREQAKGTTFLAADDDFQRFSTREKWKNLTSLPEQATEAFTVSSRGPRPRVRPWRWRPGWRGRGPLTSFQMARWDTAARSGHWPRPERPPPRPSVSTPSPQPPPPPGPGSSPQGWAPRPCTGTS